MPYQSVPFSSLLFAVQADQDGSPYWNAEEVRLAWNEALRVWNLGVGRWTRRLVLPTVQRQVWYTLPGTLTYAAHCWWNDVPLLPAAFGELDKAHPGWETHHTLSSAGYANTGIPNTVVHWVPMGLTRIGVWPADYFGVSQLVVEGIADTPILPFNSLTATVDLSEAEQLILHDEVIHLLAFKEGGPRWAATLEKHVEFLRAMAHLNARFATSDYYRHALTRLGLDRAITPIVAPGAPAVPQPQTAEA